MGGEPENTGKPKSGGGGGGGLVGGSRRVGGRGWGEEKAGVTQL